MGTVWGDSGFSRRQMSAQLSISSQKAMNEPTSMLAVGLLARPEDGRYSPTGASEGWFRQVRCSRHAAVPVKGALFAIIARPVVSWKGGAAGIQATGRTILFERCCFLAGGFPNPRVRVPISPATSGPATAMLRVRACARCRFTTSERIDDPVSAALGKPAASARTVLQPVW